jgi:hypothetical protein
VSLLAITFLIAGCHHSDSPDDTSDSGPPESDSGAPDGGTLSAGVVVHAANARACDLLLQDGDATVTGITFDSAVKGEWSRMAPRAAFAFTSVGDSALTHIGKLSVRGDLHGPNAFKTTKITCYDRTGNPLPDATVGFERP